MMNQRISGTTYITIWQAAMEVFAFVSLIAIVAFFALYVVALTPTKSEKFQGNPALESR